MARFRRSSLLALIAGVAMFVVTGCGGPSEADKAKEDAAAKKQAEVLKAKAQFTLCDSQIGPFIKALEELQSRVAIGLNYRDYGVEVGDTRVAYDRVPIDEMGPECLAEAGIKAESAMNEFTKALDSWDKCFQSLDCSNDDVEPALQKRWLRADRLITEATDGLDAMQRAGSQASSAAD